MLKSSQQKYLLENSVYSNGRMQELQQISPIRVSFMITFVFLGFRFNLIIKTCIIIYTKPKYEEKPDKPSS